MTVVPFQNVINARIVVPIFSMFLMMKIIACIVDRLSSGKKVKRMRDYLFHGKRLDNGEWVESGCIFKLINKSGDHFFIPQLGEELIATHDDNMMNIVALENMTMYRVDPETVGQYTGVRDCKRTEEYPDGQMIFEGDVVLCDRHINDEFDKKTFFVREIYPISGLIGESLSGNEIRGDDWEFAEVIGNIHDNPEILKEGGEE